MVEEEMDMSNDDKPNNNVEISKYNQYPYVNDQMCYFKNS
jgi:hypothetical protein